MKILVKDIQTINFCKSLGGTLEENYNPTVHILRQMVEEKNKWYNCQVLNNSNGFEKTNY